MKKTFLFLFFTLCSVALFAGDGTKENPYTCAEAIALQQADDYREALVWVKGFIVGVPCQGEKGAVTYKTEATEENLKQLALADNIYGDNWMPVRFNDYEELAIYDLSVYRDANNIGKKVAIRCVPQAFYGREGAKNASEYVELMPIAVTGVTLDQTSAEIYVNQVLSLKATILPADADNQHITWQSDNASAASVDAEGNVTGLRNGAANITVTTIDGAKTASCKITVTTASGETLMGDVITADTTGVTTNSLKENQPNRWNGKVCASGTSYAGKTATDNKNISLKGGSGADQGGIINTNTVGFIRQIIIKWASNAGDRTINVYGTNTQWASVDDLFNGDSKTVTDGDIIGTLDYTTGSTTDTVNVEGNYQYVGLWATSSKAHYFEKVSFVWGLTKAGDDVALESLSLDTTSLKLEETATYKLKVTYNPTNATYKAVTWRSSNTAVATVQGGLVTAVAEGEADITVTSNADDKISATCHVVVTKLDVFRGRDVYYKVKTLDELHTHDTVVFVNEEANRVSADFETYEYKKKGDDGLMKTYIYGRLRASETELIRVGDSIGSWGAEEVHLVKVEGGKWKILVSVWSEEDEFGLYEKYELPLIATDSTKLAIEGEGTQTWTIDMVDGNAVITSTDAAVGSLQFNGNNKTFTTYTSAQQPIQIYRKKVQSTSTENPEPNPDDSTENAISEITIDGVLYADGVIYNTRNLPLRVYALSGQLLTTGNSDIDIIGFERGVYVVTAPIGVMKIVR